jgi:hypothetical protein
MGHGSLIYVDGQLVILSEYGELVIAEANVSHYSEKTRVSILQRPSRTPPSLSNGYLYLRNLWEIVCLDLH